ncbi:MAG: fasciclin domain-containing protein [Bacteroidia bacterium]|nr:fasciclin domain-containing protein [Bacteroidia bacterium]
MKTSNILFLLVTVFLLNACGGAGESTNTASGGGETAQAPLAGQSAVDDGVSEKDIVKVAVGSKDHTTLVAALKAAEYVDVLANAGPFTVFAPTNEAFNKLPKGTVEGLLVPDKKGDLRNILEYHVYVGVYREDMLQDGQSIGQANGDNIQITKKDGKLVVNGTANVLATVKASNGLIYVIDGVLLPPAKK